MLFPFLQCCNALGFSVWSVKERLLYERSLHNALQIVFRTHVLLQVNRFSFCFSCYNNHLKNHAIVRMPLWKLFRVSSKLLSMHSIVHLLFLWIGVMVICVVLCGKGNCTFTRTSLPLFTMSLVVLLFLRENWNRSVFMTGWGELLCNHFVCSFEAFSLLLEYLFAYSG